MSVDNFVQLHLHNEFSIKDGVGSTKDVIDKAISLGLKSVSITNHGHLGHTAKQYFLCNQKDIKPIFGCEVYVNEDRLKIKTLVNEIEDMAKKYKKDKEVDTKEKLEKLKLLRSAYKKNEHLVIFAKNRVGFKNLLNITGDAWINGFYYSPRTDYEYIQSKKEGLIVTSACLASRLNGLIMANKIDAAEKLLNEFKEIYGEDFYIELMLFDEKEQIKVNRMLIELASKTKVKTIITNDCHYLDKDDAKLQDILLMMREDKTFKDIEEGASVWKFKIRDLWYKDYNETREMYDKHYKDIIKESVFLQSIENVREIESKIEKFDISATNSLPKYGDDPYQFLKNKVKEGLKRRGVSTKPEYIERTKYELSIIERLEFSDFFLVMSDIVNYAKDEGVEVGPGRGSAAGSMISYLLNITDIDPLKFGLLFERFLNVDRKDIPDVDTDFEPESRDKIKEFIFTKFGREHTASVGTYSMFKTKSVIQDVSRLYSIDVKEVLAVTKKVGFDADDLEWPEIFKEYPFVRDYFNKYPEIGGTVMKLRGQVRHLGKHAAGVVITGDPIIDCIPVMAQDGNTLTSWTDGGDSREITGLGFVKFDILGLNNLSVVKDTVKLLKTKGIVIDWDKIPLDDSKAFELASNCDTLGIFQFDTNLMRSLIKAIKIDSFSEISAISSLGRPGPLHEGMHTLYADIKFGRNSIVTPDILKDILDETKGIIIYQEQIMLIAQKLANFTLSQANTFRKALVKYGSGKEFEEKRREEAKSYHDQFVKEAYKKLPEKEVDEIWDKIISFASYGFNKSHSVSYAMTTYRELYLKAHHKLEFMCALMMNTAKGVKDGDESRIKRYLSSATRDGIKVLPPDVNCSQVNFAIEGESIRVGFSSIKSFGDNAQQVIENRPYDSLEDFFKKNKDLGKRSLESLIGCGALDTLQKDRNESYKLFYSKYCKSKIEYKEKNKEEITDGEIEYLTFSLSEDNNKMLDKMNRFIEKNKWDKLSDIETKDRIKTLAIVGSLTLKKSKKGNKYGVLRVENEDFSCELNIWDKQLGKYSKLLKRNNVIAIKISRNEDILVLNEKMGQAVIGIKKEMEGQKDG